MANLILVQILVVFGAQQGFLQTGRLESLICQKHKEFYDSCLSQIQEKLQEIHQKILNVISLQQDANTYVPEKEGEMEQAKRWSEIAQKELVLEKQRFEQRDFKYQKTIEGCQEAILLLGTIQNEPVIAKATLGELKERLEGGLTAEDKLVSSLIAVSEGSVSVQDTIKLLEQLKGELQASRSQNRINHEKSMEGAQAYKTQKEYTYENLTRQSNIILRNQILLQEEIYHLQFEQEILLGEKAQEEERIGLLQAWCSEFQ